jgi:hypothetical protein
MVKIIKKIKNKRYEIDINSEKGNFIFNKKYKEMNQIHDLLKNNYVEDSNNIFRIKYTKEFINFIFKSPNWNEKWSISIKEGEKMIAFIHGFPKNLNVDDKMIQMAEIGFLVIDKGYRSKRLSTLLIKEITRRVHLYSGIELFNGRDKTSSIFISDIDTNANNQYTCLL